MKKLLIVEDCLITAMYYKAALSDFEIVGVVSTGEEALIIAKEKDPDVIISDVNLAGKMTGIDVAAKIAKPIIFISGSDPEELKSLKPVAIFSKPVNMNEVIRKIKEIEY